GADAMLLERILPVSGGPLGAEDEDIGGGGHRLCAWKPQTMLGQLLRAAMVVGEPVDDVGEANDAAGREDARLPHSPAHPLSPILRLLNKGLGAAQNRAHRRAESFAEAEVHRIYVLSDLGNLHPQTG